LPKPGAAGDAANGQPAPQGGGRVLDPVGSIWRHRRIALAIMAFIAAAGSPIAWTKGKSIWSAQGVLYVSPRFQNNLETSEEQLLQSNQQYREFMQQQIRTVNRYDIIESVLKKDGFMDTWRKGKESDRHAVERLQGGLTIAPVPDTYQVTISLEGDQAKGLAEIINAVMARFTETSRRELMWDSTGRLASLNAEKKKLEANMTALMERKSERANELGTTVFNDSAVNSYDQRLNSALNALEEARQQRFAAEAAISSKALPGLDAASIEKAMNDGGLSSLRDALDKRRANILASIHGYGPKHILRLDAEKEVAEIDAQIAQMTEDVRTRMIAEQRAISQSKYEQAKQLEQQLQGEVDRMRSQAETYSRAFQDTLEVGDEMSRIRKRLNAIEDRINFITLEAGAPGFVRIFTPAMPPEQPAKGGKKKLFMMVFAAALLLGLIVPVAIDFLDPRILTARELEGAAGMPVSGEVKPGKSPNRLAVAIRRNIPHVPRKAIVMTGIADRTVPAAAAAALADELNALGVPTLVVESRDKDLLVPDPLQSILDGAKDYQLVLVTAPPVTKSLGAEELVRAAGAVLLVVAGARDTKPQLKAALALLSKFEPAAFGTVFYAGPESPAVKSIKQSGPPNDPTNLLAA
jgi:uncharacterized protein involved in exopolysaccharide biosynthesis